MKDLFILILNYNSYQETLSLFNILQVDELNMAKILVIDNNSNDLNKRKLKEIIPCNQLMLLSENKGYAAGNNKGIQKAIAEDAKAILILNPDIQIQPLVIINLYNKLFKINDVAALGTRICFREQPDTIYSDGGLVDKEHGFKTYHLNSGKKNCEVNSKHLNTVDYVNGSVFMAKTETFKRVGLMKESFFLYFEETEWCLRARSLGLKLYIDPSLTAYHLSSAKNTRYHFYMIRNRLWLAKAYPEYYSTTLHMVKSHIIRQLIKELKALKIPDKHLRARIKGLIMGHFSNAS